MARCASLPWMKQYAAYVMASYGRTLYVGVTGDLGRRVYEHGHGLMPGFTKRYAVTRLVYFELTVDVSAAIAREKEIKAWRRSKKVALMPSTIGGPKCLA